MAQLVGRLVWDQDAASSSLATRTKSPESASAESGLFCLHCARFEQLNATRMRVADASWMAANLNFFALAKENTNESRNWDHLPTEALIHDYIGMFSV